MSRKPRILQPEYSYHVTVRCNNREFRLTKLECHPSGSQKSKVKSQKSKLQYDELKV